MFSAFQTFGKLGAIGKAIASASAWSPLALWPDGISSAGMWISPRTLTSEWQDYTGTTPVSVPGTVADSANPVGLALDIRAGAPEVLGPELLDRAADAMAANWTDAGGGVYTSAGSGYLEWYGLTASKTYLVSFRIVSISAGALGEVNTITGKSVPGTYSGYVRGVIGLGFYASGFVGVSDSFSAKEVPGNHMLQSTSAARPLMSAYDGQTLGPGNTYDATGYPIFQKYDGVDDGMATAAFSAGTLIDGMDCMIAVRRDSAAHVILGPYKGPSDLGNYIGNAESGYDSPCYTGVGSPTVWVDGVQLTHGWASELAAAMTVGDWHILEFRGLDLSTWTGLGVGLFGIGYNLNGARGDILLYPSTASTEDKDAARQWLADYYGVTLP